ncbi:MAG: SDR family oxidoreductase, partial [Acetobacteraceae bacterium]
MRILANVDVAHLACVEHAADVALATFCRVDCLINCTGVAEDEEMVVDMRLEAWRRTLDASLVSNYPLIRRRLAQMKRQGSGHVVTVSSYFGGERDVSIPQQNRASYATAKAGRRALAENLARVLGPETQINATSPGPVERERPRGDGGGPGLCERRARLILERTRPNAVHALLVRAARDGASCGTFLMTRAVAEKPLTRLSRGGAFLQQPDGGVRFEAGWIADPPAPPEEVTREAERIRSGVLSLLQPGRMPTEFEVAQATVFCLADRAVSGRDCPALGRAERRTLQHGARSVRPHAERAAGGVAGPHRL